METDLDLDRFRRLLEVRLSELDYLIALANERAKPVELDQTRVGRLSRMDALQDQAMAKDTVRRRIIEYRKVENALRRIESDDYGYCMSCDELIPIRRLEFDPASTTCVDCATG